MKNNRQYHNMTHVSRFDSIKRLEPYVDNSRMKDGYESWRVVGGISFSFKQNGNRIDVNIPNYFVTIGPIIPFNLSRNMAMNDPVFKAGIFHDYLCYKLKLRVNGEVEKITRSVADDVFLKIMKELKVPMHKRYFYFILSKFKKYPDPKQSFLF